MYINILIPFSVHFQVLNNILSVLSLSHCLTAAAVPLVMPTVNGWIWEEEEDPAAGADTNPPLRPRVTPPPLPPGVTLHSDPPVQNDTAPSPGPVAGQPGEIQTSWFYYV